MKCDETYFSELFGLLGERLQGGLPVDVVREACRTNGWFTPHSIRMAIDALCRQMLCRDKVYDWLSRYKPDYGAAKSVGVVMAGNIPAVGFFDMMCVLCAGHECSAKLSSKDAVIMEYLIGLLKELAPELPLSKMDNRAEFDAVIATGSDNSAVWFRSRFPDTPMLMRGSMHSVAVLTGRESEDEWRLLAEDMFAHSGLGCRNVGTLLIPDNYSLDELPMMFASARQMVSERYLDNWRHTRAMLIMNGERFVDGGFFALKESDDFPSEYLSCIGCIRYETEAAAESWLSEHAGRIQCVVGAGHTAFGAAQYPTLTDYPDGVDVMEFLLSL